MTRCGVIVLFVCSFLPNIKAQETTLVTEKNEENTTTTASFKPVSTTSFTLSTSTSGVPQSTELPFKPIQLTPFSQLAHGLKSGPITILDNKTFFVPNLHYDGKAPDAHFWVGNGPGPSKTGIPVPDENGSTDPLSAFNGQNVTIRLPDGLTVDQIDYFGIWCRRFAQNFGHVLTPKGRDTSKQLMVQKQKETLLGIQLEPFKQLAHGLRSGPIIIVDKKTFFIPNLHYDGKGPDAHFWVGKGKEPSSSGILVPDEKGSRNTISAYTGQNIYIRLPDDLTIDQFDYFGVWCIQYKHNFGHVVIPKNLEMPNATNHDPDKTEENKKIVRVQKCCPLNQVLTVSGCADENQRFEPTIDVHDHNSTHLDDVPITKGDIMFEPFVNHIHCEHKQYPLIPNDDQFALLRNGSLMVLDTHKLLTQDEYCMETIDFGDESGSDWLTTAIICFGSGEVPTSSTLFIIYAVGISISAIFLVITALVFLLIKEVRDARGKCIVAYSLSMAAGFICLASAQFYGIDNEKVCNLVGFTIQFFLVSSFTWLTMVSWETYYKIRKHNCEAYSKDRRRLIIYSVIGIAVPLLTLIISIIVDQIPDLPNTFMKPHFGRNSCWFDQKEGSMLYFYIPIGIAIFFNIVLAALMKWNLVRFQRLRKLDISWLALRHELKPMFRSCTFLLTVMTLCWLMEIVSFLTKSDGGVWIAFDIISSLQGLIIFIIFVLHRPVKDKICKPKRELARSNDPEGRPLKVFKENGTSGNHDNHSEFLTNLKRADSTENIAFKDKETPTSNGTGDGPSMNVFNINDVTNSTNASQSNYNSFLKNLRFIDSVDDLT
ncbi:hypothetical protein ILUMI_08049 [Ignelater luminosus]|uniref:Uncharacterized protein n=1 Tax=Ignelater luminosus TaxID=2038154 RepID=A0A8K0GB11_IGNLU|nr:hypothetical protein ILUMI_08049 [Ignelater luminosus]